MKRRKPSNSMCHGLFSRIGRLAIMFTFLLTALIFNPISAEAATNYYVSTTGSDSNPGTLSQPWRTIQKAADAMGAGDTAYIRGGTYDRFRIKYSGTDNNYITFRNYPGETPVIEPTGASLEASVYFESVLGYRTTINWVIVDGLEIKDATNNGIKGYNMDHIIIRNCNIHDSYEQNILICGSQYITIDSNKIHHSAQWATDSNLYHGIYATGRYYTVTNNLFYNNMGYGLQVAGYSVADYDWALPGYDLAEHWTIANNTFSGNVNEAGIVLWEGYGDGCLCDDMKVVNNIFYKNSESVNGENWGNPNGVHLFTCSNVLIRKNVYFGTQQFIGTSGSAQYTAESNTNADPQFVNEAVFDFHLKTTSPCIDIADSTYAPDHDLDEALRPHGIEYDIGAFELGSPIWYSKNDFSAVQNLGSENTGVQKIEFDVTPLSNSINAFIGYTGSSTDINENPWSSFAMIIRMNTDGCFDVRNGMNYQALENVPYSANRKYHIKIIANMGTKTYNVLVKPDGGSWIMIANGYAFRTDALAMDDVGQVCLWSNGNDNLFKVENHAVIVYSDADDVAAAKAAIEAANYTGIVVANTNDQTLKIAAVQDLLNEAMSGAAITGVTATVNYNAGTVNYDVTISKNAASSATSITTATFVLAYSLTVDDKNPGGAGFIRTITIGGANAGNLTGKYLVVKFAEGEGDNAKSSVIMISPISQEITVSYKTPRTKLEVWLTNDMPDLTAQNMGVTVYAHTCTDQ